MPYQLSSGPRVVRRLAAYQVDGLAIPYPEFVPRLYNLCMSLGFRRGLIMPSRAFCSDENQGWPIILLTKHFGSFPFNHGRVGGVAAIDRHGPHAHHGEDSLILQATHVGYDPHTGAYGKCVRPMMTGEAAVSNSCGKITHVITPYLEQYNFAGRRIFLHRDEGGRHLITVKNSFIDFSSHPVDNGLVLRLEKIVRPSAARQIEPLAALSASQIYEVSEAFAERLTAAGHVWSAEPVAIGDHLKADLFFFREDFHETDESLLLERSLAEFMPEIVTSVFPPLRAAQILIQLEFARVVESIRRGTEYEGKNLLYVAGLNLDISEYEGFPATTYFVPWAAHVQLRGGTSATYQQPLEQDKLFSLLQAQKVENPDQTNLKEEIGRMLKAPRFDIRAPR